MWVNKSKDRYVAGLKSEPISDRLNTLMDLEIASEITDVLISNVQPSKKRQRTPKQYKHQSAP